MQYLFIYFAFSTDLLARPCCRLKTTTTTTKPPTPPPKEQQHQNNNKQTSKKQQPPTTWIATSLSIWRPAVTWPSLLRMTQSQQYHVHMLSRSRFRVPPWWLASYLAKHKWSKGTRKCMDLYVLAYFHCSPRGVQKATYFWCSFRYAQSTDVGVDFAATDGARDVGRVAAIGVRHRPFDSDASNDAENPTFQRGRIIGCKWQSERNTLPYCR